MSESDLRYLGFCTNRQSMDKITVTTILYLDLFFFVFSCYCGNRRLFLFMYQVYLYNSLVMDARTYRPRDGGTALIGFRFYSLGMDYH